MSEEKQTIFEALEKVQENMPVIGRDKTAKIGDKFSYTYADLEKIVTTARPIVKAQGFIVNHYGDGENVVTMAFHKASGQSLTSKMKISQLDPQKKGAEVTYYRRYNYCMLFDILVADEDKDATGTGEVNAEKLEVIVAQLELLSTVDELTSYYKQLGSPKDKDVLKAFTHRKNEMQ
jgi:hypothetical protein